MEKVKLICTIMMLGLCLQSKAAGYSLSPKVIDSDMIDSSDFVQKVVRQKGGLIKPGKGDLPIHNLYGPVKSCIEELEGDEEQEYYDRKFDRNGRLTMENGESLKELFPKGVKRNKSGRLIFGNRDFGEIRYVFDQRGLLKQIIWTDKTDGTTSKEVRVYSYNKQGHVNKIVYLDGVFPPTTYTILEVDQYGNWTKKKDQNGQVINRKITYYE